MQSTWDNDVPQLRNLRRIPTQYRRMLPLEFMKLYQCAIIGDEEGVLTLAITESCAISTLRLIGKMTGQSLFPVLVGTRRMRYLIRHIERADYPGYKRLKPPFFIYTDLKSSQYF